MSTALDAYLERNGIKDAEFAPRIGRDRSMVSKLRRGIVRPTLDLAATIEAETHGEVPMRSWLADSSPAQADAA
jgi:transcriptional regulator with XRE-family HTH domain